MTMQLSSVSWEGFISYQAYLQEGKNGQPASVSTEKTGQELPDKVLQPVFGSAKFTTSITMPVSAVQFLGTLNAGSNAAPDSKDKPSRLVFGRVTTLQITPPIVPPEDASTLESQMSIFSMEPEDARAILAQDPKTGSYYAAVKELMGRGKAKSEYSAVLKSKSGQRAVLSEGVKEVKYPTEYSQRPGESRASASAFGTESVGFDFEVEIVASPESVVDFNMAPKLSRVVGNGLGGNYQEHPLIEVRQITTALSAAMGEQAFVGTLSPPLNTKQGEQKDAQRIWLAFVRTIGAKP
jgi:hypothetical protein